MDGEEFAFLNSFNSIQGNLITNCFTGIYFYGYAAPEPFDAYDIYNDFGSTPPRLAFFFHPSLARSTGFPLT